MDVFHQTPGLSPVDPFAAASRHDVTERATTRRPFVGALFLLTVAMMFTLSGSVLWDLGLNYSGITGSAFSKIHPATYLACLTFSILVVARTNPAAFLAKFVTRYPGAFAFLVATVLLGTYIALDGRRGIATVFDNYLLAIAISVIAGEIDERTIARAEKLIHLLLAANALLALGEYASDHRVFPHRFEGVAFDWDRRSTALLGHPLENAHFTGTYLMVLLAGGGSNLSPSLRFPAFLLQFAALVPFGGRTALLLVVALTTLWGIPRAMQGLRGARVSLPMLAAVFVFAPLFPLAVGLSASAGFFNVVTDRFADDGGSAQTRLAMLDVFEQLSWGDILLGGDADFIDSIRRTRGLEWGIENPLVRLILYQGLAFTIIILVGFVLFLFEIVRRSRSGTMLPVAFFLLVANSYESIGNKSIMLAQFVVLILVMFHTGTGFVAARLQRRSA